MPSPCCRLGFGTGRPSEPWRRSRPLVSSHPATVTSSQKKTSFSSRVSQTCQIMLRRRMNATSLTNCYMPMRAWATACSSTPSTNFGASGAWACCAVQACSPHQGHTGWKGEAKAHLGPSSVGRQLHAVPYWADCAGTPGRRCGRRQAPPQGSRRRGVAHLTTYRSVRLSGGKADNLVPRPQSPWHGGRS